MSTEALRRLAWAAELADLAEACRARALDMIAFKGPTLALLTSGDVTSRRFNDLDLLFRPAELERAHGMLRERGYQCPGTPSGEAPYRPRGTGHTIWVHPTTGVNVEPHWRLLPPDFAPRLDLSGVWARSRTVFLGGRPVRTLGPEDLVLYLALHAFKHAWERAKWLEDLHRAIETSAGLDWRVVVDFAVHGGVRRALHASLHLARRTHGTALPPWVASAVSRDRRARALVMTEVRRQRAHPGPSRSTIRRTGRLVRLRALGHDSPLGMLRMAAVGLLAPTRADLEWARLPRPLAPLYWALRPVRLLLRTGRRMLLGRA